MFIYFQYASLLFLGLAVLGLFYSFKSVSLQVRNRRKARYLNIDLFAVFAIAALLVGAGSALSMWNDQMEWKDYARGGMWIFFSLIIVLFSVYFFKKLGYSWKRIINGPGKDEDIHNPDDMQDRIDEYGFIDSAYLFRPRKGL